MSEHEQAQMSEAQPCHATTTLGHELRTPLNHIIGYTILLEEAKDGQLEPFSADLQKIHTAGKKLLTLVNAFVGVAKLEGSAPSRAPHTAGRLSHLRDEETYDEASVQPAAPSGHLAGAAPRAPSSVAAGAISITQAPWILPDGKSWPWGWFACLEDQVWEYQALKAREASNCKFVILNPHMKERRAFDFSVVRFNYLWARKMFKEQLSNAKLATRFEAR
jgi:His Kinase A (phospho-acceptor) domain